MASYTKNIYGISVSASGRIHQRFEKHLGEVPVACPFSSASAECTIRCPFAEIAKSHNKEGLGRAEISCVAGKVIHLVPSEYFNNSMKEDVDE